MLALIRHTVPNGATSRCQLAREEKLVYLEWRVHSMVTVFVVVHSDNVAFVLKFAFILLSSP